MLLSNVGVRVEQHQRVFLGFGRNNKTRSNPATQSTYCAPNWLTIIHAVQRRVGFGARIAAGHLCLPNKSGTIAVPAFQPVVDGSSLQPMSTDGHTSLICTEAAIGFYIMHLQGVIFSDISLDSLAVLQKTCYTTRHKLQAIRTATPDQYTNKGRHPGCACNTSPPLLARPKNSPLSKNCNTQHPSSCCCGAINKLQALRHDLKHVFTESIDCSNAPELCHDHCLPLFVVLLEGGEGTHHTAGNLVVHLVKLQRQTNRQTNRQPGRHA